MAITKLKDFVNVFHLLESKNVIIAVKHAHHKQFVPNVHPQVVLEMTFL
jgi:hypothetical protein